MHIGFRTSGGRGEYELVGELDGLHASQAKGWSLELHPSVNGSKDLNVTVNPGSSGKARLRLKSQTTPQVGRQAAAMLMLPDPSRSRTGLTHDSHFLKKRYFLTRIGFSTDTSLDRPNRVIRIRPTFVEIDNGATTELIWFDSRLARVKQVASLSAQLPADLKAEVDAHQTSTQKSPIEKEAVTAVDRVMGELARTQQRYRAESDPLPELEAMLGLDPDSVGYVPEPTKIDDEDPRVRVRAAAERRVTKARGASAARFSREVRAAYDHSCLMCGLRFPGIPGRKSGVDAAHILAWSNWDLDVVQNGLCLCKNHHWAFDAGVLTVTFDGGQYHVHFNAAVADDLHPDTIAALKSVEGPVPHSRLPTLPQNQPSPKYLQQLHEDVPLGG